MTDKAFTLAEVLITLGIIGIVAAMTMPVLTGRLSIRSLKPDTKLPPIFCIML